MHFDSANDEPALRRTVMFVLDSAVDCAALTLWCKHHVECELVDCATDLTKGLDRCRRLRPGLLTVDPAIAERAVERATELLRQEVVGHLLLLDQRPVELHLAHILTEPAASYFTRSAPPLALAMAIREILESGRRAFDPALAPRVRRTAYGLEFDHSPEVRPIAQLSEREKQVMRLLAEGMTVRQCAQELGLSESTVDNHKSRLMKKLSVHKSSELTLRALRAGLIRL